MTEVRDRPVHAVPPPPRSRLRIVLSGLGQTLITAGVVVLLFVVYELFVTNLFNAHTQGRLTTTLRQEWQGDNPTVGPIEPTEPALPDAKLGQLPLGQGFAFIRIPRLGLDYVRVVLEGSDASELAEGPGHYVGTAQPGEVGNFALAGHRVSKGAPFLNLDHLVAGDAIVIETQTQWFVYRMLGPAAADPDAIPGSEIVAPTDTDVVAPVPDHPGATPHRAMLTLTTCNPKFSAAQRLIIHAELDGAPLAKTDYPAGPPALQGG